MSNNYILEQLDSLTNIPTIPAYLSRVMSALDNDNISAKTIASLIERDQSLTSKVLKAANSPIYGQSKQVSTVELAIVLMGLNTIKEMVINMLLEKFFSNIPKQLFDSEAFWFYSHFCGSTSRVIARRFKFKRAGEAYISGLMHDMGILVLVQAFTHEFREIKNLMLEKNIDIFTAEKEVIDTTHSKIGAWLCKKWNLPSQLAEAIAYHHEPISEINKADISDNGKILSRIVAISEWFAQRMEQYNWYPNDNHPSVHSDIEEVYVLSNEQMIDKKSWFQLLKQNIHEEYQRSLEVSNF